MGMFDWYVPKPPVRCPHCSTALTGWQGKDGPCALFEWVQGQVSPSRQLVDDEGTISDAERSEVRLPDEFELYAPCNTCNGWVEAYGSCEDAIWNRFDL